MIITPYSKLATTLEPTAANFPALGNGHLWKFNEATGAVEVVDTISGLTVGGDVGLALTNVGNGSVTFPETYANINAGTLKSPDTKSILAFAIYNPAAANKLVVFGSTTAAANQGIRIQPGTTGPKIADGTTVRTGTVMRAGGANGVALYALSITPNSATGFKPMDFDLTTGTWTDRAASETNTATAYTTMAAIEQAVSFPASSPMFMAGLMYFESGIPADVKAGLEWMATQAVTTPYNKTIYPGWKGLA